MSHVPSDPDTWRDYDERDPAHRLAPRGHSHAEPVHSATGIEALLESPRGYIVGRLGDRVLRLATDGHLLTVAPTRSGKGASCVIPNLLDHPGSAFVVDIRGETVTRTADARLLMGQHVVVLDPYEVTGARWGYDTFNPLEILVPGTPGFEQHVRRTSQAILFDREGRSSREPIWDNATLLALNGALTYLKTCLPREQQTLDQLSRLFAMNPTRRAAIADEVIERARHSGIYAATIERFIDFLTTGSDRTKIPDNTIYQLMTVLDWVTHQEFARNIAASTFSFDLLQARPTTVYLVLPEEYIQGAEVWVRLLFNAALFRLKEVNALFGRASRDLDQAQRVLFLLDEFPAFGRLQPVEDGLATIAARGATLWLFVQHISQLDRIYGEHSARQIVGNASLIQAFNSNEVHELEYFSRVVGEEMFDVQSVTLGMNESAGESTGASRTVTVGNSESTTAGTSRSTTHGESFTVTDGTSSTETRGTSRTVSDGRTYGRQEGVSTGESYNEGVSTSRTRGTNRSVGGGVTTQTGQSVGTSGEYTALDYLGVDLPMWQGKNASRNWGQSSNRNWSQGISDSISTSKNRGRSTSTTRNTGTSESINHSISQGMTESTSRGVTHSVARGTSTSETEGTSESRTSGTSRSEADGETQTETRSRGFNVTYSVKPELRKIETPRSLRRTMGNGAQLLALRGHYAFLAPRLIYFEKRPGVPLYRFPQMAILSRETTLAEVHRHVLESLPAPRAEGPSVLVSEDWGMNIGDERERWAVTDFLDRLTFADLPRRLRTIYDAALAPLSPVTAAAPRPAPYVARYHDEYLELMHAALTRLYSFADVCEDVLDEGIGADSLSALGAYAAFVAELAALAGLGTALPKVTSLVIAPAPPQSVAPITERLSSLPLFDALLGADWRAQLEANYQHATTLDGPWLLEQYETALRSLGIMLREVNNRNEAWRQAYQAAARELEEYTRTTEQGMDDALFEAAKREVERRRQWGRGGSQNSHDER